MHGVTALRLEDGVRLQPERLAFLLSAHGPRTADEILCDTVAAIGLVLDRMAATGGGHPDDELANLAELADLAARIGLRSLEEVAADVGTALAAGDAAAVAATRARLGRVAGRSLRAVQDWREMTDWHEGP